MASDDYPIAHSAGTTRQSIASALALVLLASLFVLAPASAVQAQVSTPDHSELLSSLDSPTTGYVPTGGGTDQVVYSPSQDRLLVRNSATQLRVIDASTGDIVSTRWANHRFTDISMTTDGLYFFAADYGARPDFDEFEDFGAEHFVHRYDVVAGTWLMVSSPFWAWRIEAVASDRGLLDGGEQSGFMTLHSFGPAAMAELSRVFSDYGGDFEFDPVTGRIYKGMTDLPPGSVLIRQLTGDELSIVGDTGFDGAENGGPTSVLTPDGATFFYGPLQFAATDFNAIEHEYPSPVVGASENFAFLQDGTVWFIPNREPVGALGWNPKTVHGSQDGGVWIVHPDNRRIFRCSDTAGLLSCSGGPTTTSSVQTPNHAAELATLADNGQSLPGGSSVQMLASGGGNDLLYLRGAGLVQVIDRSTNQIIDTLQSVPRNFNDIAVTPDGEFLFVLESGSDQPVPVLHRYEVSTATWTSATLDREAVSVAAVSDSRVLLSRPFDGVSVNTYFPVGVVVTEADGLNYEDGQLDIDPATGHVLVATDSWIDLVRFEGPYPQTIINHPTDQSPSRSTLSADGEHFFYGRSQVETIDPTNEQHEYPSQILAATTNYAFAEDGTVWFIDNAEPVGTLGWTPVSASAPADDSGDVLLGHLDGRIFTCTDMGIELSCERQFDPTQGDANCDDSIDLIDALVIAQYVNGTRTAVDTCDNGITVSEVNVANADVNGDGTVDSADALVLTECQAGIASEDCS